VNNELQILSNEKSVLAKENVLQMKKEEKLRMR